MNRWSIKKGEVLAALFLLIISGLVVMGNGSALEPQTGNISFVVIYKDAGSGSTDFVAGVKASLYDVYGNLVDSQVSSPLVNFKNMPYGVYTIRIDPVKIGSYVYDAGYAIIKLNGEGVKYLDGQAFNNITLMRYALNSKISLDIENNGNPVEAHVNVYFHNCEIGNATVKGNEIINGNNATPAEFSVTFPAVLKITRNEGGVNEVYYTVAKSAGSITVNISQYSKVWGLVWDSATGSIVATQVHVGLVNKGTDSMLYSWKTPSGAFSMYLKNSEFSMYSIVITAEGYSVATVAPKTTMTNVYVDPLEDNYTHVLKFSDDMKSMQLTYSFKIYDATVMRGLPFSVYGVLHYQMKSLGMDVADLQMYMENRIFTYTDKFVKVDNQIYELQNSYADWSSENGIYTVTIHATYANDNIDKKDLLKDGEILLNLYAYPDETVGVKRYYVYVINPPGDLERSNDVSSATVNGYVNSITVTNAQSMPVTLVLKERKAPAVYLDPMHFRFGWKNSQEKDYIVNQSADNYTIVVPVGKEVWFNVSTVFYDIVRDRVDAANTTYVWSVDNVKIGEGKGVANVTHIFDTGKHALKIEATDVGGNTNSTTIVVLADSCWPTVNFVIKAPSGKVLGTVNATANLQGLNYNFGGKKGAVKISGNSAKLPVTLVINQSEEIVYDASKSYDTYDGSHRVTLPIEVEWDFNGNNATGINKTYAFDKPTRDKNGTISVKFSDAVGNNVTVSFNLVVKDITKPVAKVSIKSDGKEVSEVKEGSVVVLDASKSYDPQNGTIASYSWTIKNSKYKVLSESNNTFEIINGSLSSSKVEIKFTTYGTYYIILNITDKAGNYAVVNRTLHVTPVRPDLGIVSVDVKGEKVEGNKLTFAVNVTNNGNANASVYYISIIVNGKEVANQSFSDLKAGSHVINDVAWTPSSPGKYKVTVKVYCPAEPSSYLSDNEKKVDVTVNQAAWKTPALVLGIIIIIGVIGYFGWVAQKKKKEGKKFLKKTKSAGEKKKKK